MSLEISIQEMLAEITGDEMNGKTFVIQFVRSSGPKKGTIATVSKARYGNPKGFDRANKNKGIYQPRQKQVLHKEKGTIPLTDTERNRYFTPLISHIIGYNQYKVRH